MKTHITREKGSITLGMVYGLGLLSLGVASLALSSVVTNLSTHKNEMSGVRTFVTADSAAREGTYRLITQPGFTGSADGVDLNSVLGSSIALDSSVWPYIDVVGGADNALTKRGAMYRVQPSALSLAFDHAIYSQQNLDISGAAKVYGNIYAHNTIEINNSAAQVHGGVRAGDDIDLHKNSNVYGAVSSSSVHLNPPIISSAPYETNMLGCYKATTDDLDEIVWSACERVHLEVANGETLVISGLKDKGKGKNVEFSGTLLIEGNVKITGGVFSCNNLCPMAIYVLGDLELTGGDITGIVYVTGKTTVGTGNPEITGSLISIGGVGGISVLGNLTVTYDPILMNDWEDIGGLDLSGGTDPTVVNWGAR
jgi:hypothetical protein